jgi:hypothetical protein
MQPKHGFPEYVKDPELFRQEAREMARAKASSPPTAGELAELVSAMGRRKLDYQELQKLQKGRKGPGTTVASSATGREVPVQSVWS